MLKVTCPTFLQAAVHLCVVQDAHRYSAVVIESYVPPLLCRRCCDSTHFCSQAKIRHRWCCCSKLRGRFHEDSRSVRHAEIKTQNLSKMSEDTLTVRCKGWRCWLLSRPSRHGGSCGCKLMILKGAPLEGQISLRTMNEE